MRNTFISELLELAKIDDRIILITGDLGYGVVDDFAKQLPSQFLNFGINEQTMMGAAAGMAKAGLKPFVYSIGNFPTFRCLEQIRNDVCYMNLDVTIVALGSGFSYGTAGYSHHLIEDISAMSTFSNLKIFSPADPIETKLAFEMATSTTGPKYVRLGKGGEPNLTSIFDRSVLGISVLQNSEKTALITTGSILSEALLISKLPKNLQPTLISAYALNRLEDYLLEKDFKNLITLEEHVLRGGFGSLVREKLDKKEIYFQHLGIKEVHSRLVGSQDYLRNVYGLKAENIQTLFENL